MKFFVYLCSFSVLLFSTATNAEILYELVDLGEGFANSINDNGQIVGSNGYATLFDNTGGKNNINLGALGYGNSSSAKSINNNGQIVGSAKLDNGYRYATLFDTSGNRNNVNLGMLSFSGGSIARCINDNGIIGGSSLYQSGCLFDSTGGGNNVRLSMDPYGINNNGVMVGSGEGGAVIYDTGGVVNLSNASYSLAFSINDNRQTVGWNIFSDNPTATLFDTTGNMNNINLGSLFDYDYSCAQSVNDGAEIVGYSLYYPNGVETFVATLFDSTGGMNNIDLNSLIDSSLGWHLEGARDINNLGQIVGHGKIDGEIHAFLLNPIPEPNSVLLLSLGVALLRKNKSSK